jgi:hypothetical protein
MEIKPNITLSTNLEFSTTESLLSFLNREAEFWEPSKATNYNENSPLATNPVCKRIIDIIEQILNKNDNTPGVLYQTITRGITHHNFNANTFFANYFTPSTEPFAQKIIDIYNKRGEYTAHSFWETSKSGQFDLITGISRENFEGVILAYEYSVKDSDLADRKVANTKSIAEYQKQLSKLDIETRDKTSKLLDDTHDNCSDLMLELSEINKTAKTQHDEQLTENGTIFSDELKVWTSEKNRLETLYKEDLKLRPAANYWKKAAAKHERLAGFSSLLLAIVAVTSIALLSSFFYEWVETFGNPEFRPASLQGVLMFAVIIAIIAFVLKILSRIIFSSIHLSRDAEEREQLTYFYLALSNESEMSGADRTLILTSLFSRAETGLLTNEHGPTLPIADAFKSMNK